MKSLTIGKPQIWAIVSVLLVLALFAGLVASLPPGSDILWRLHLAELILDGKVLYRDMVEVNPPLWFWGALPAVLVSKIIAIPPYQASVAIVLFNALVAVWALGQLLKDRPAAERLTGQMSFWAVLLLVPIAEIGQREQAFLVACVLWSALASSRMNGAKPPFGIILLATAYAAYGFALKHYFLLAPVLIELWLLANLRGRWRPIRVETVLMVCAALIYAAAVWFLAPAFFTDTLPLVALAYEGFSPLQQGTAFQRYPFLLGSVGLSAFSLAFVWASGDRRGFTMALLICTLASIIAVIWQGKGWGYHFIAAIGLGIMVLVMSFGHAVSAKPKAALAYGVAALAGLAALIWAAPQRKTLLAGGQTSSGSVVQALAGLQTGETVQVLSIAPENSFLAPVRAGQRFTSRYFSMWMISSLLTPRADSEKDTARLQLLQQVRRHFAHDLMCAAPDRIISNLTFVRIPQRTFFDPMTFLNDDPWFARWLLANYRPIEGPDTLRQWQRFSKALVGLQPGDCDERDTKR